MGHCSGDRPSMTQALGRQIQTPDDAWDELPVCFVQNNVRIQSDRQAHHKGGLPDFSRDAFFIVHSSSTRATQCCIISSVLWRKT